jgi:hypothetical protein
VKQLAQEIDRRKDQAELLPDVRDLHKAVDGR